MATPGVLVNEDGSLTAFGKIYDNYPEDCYNFYCYDD
jgi:hypothetical protein